VETQVINCRAEKCKDGSQHLVFTIASTGKIVGEMRFMADMNYLAVIAKLFFKYTDAQLNRTLPQSIRKIIADGKRSAS
jgi:hypothetical protein